MKKEYISRKMRKKILPQRNEDTHKGDYGKILLLCGSKGFTGAASLAALGALRVGAGLVYLGVPESIYQIEATKLLEPVVFPLPDDGGTISSDAVNYLADRFPQMDAILIGPGIGQAAGVEETVLYVLKNAQCPIILDADGINVIKTHKDILRDRTAPTILTPHAGEFSRLGGDITNDRYIDAIEFAKEYGCILLLKGHRTIITNGKRCFINRTGNPGMAVGGSGDVLAGMIASLCGQGIEPLLAAACGAWLHGRAGDICASKLGEYGMLPQDMLQILPRLLP